jgi:EpsI family protein
MAPDEATEGPGSSRRQIILGGALLAVSGLAYARTPKPVVAPPRDGFFEDVVPKAVGPWSFVTASGLVLPPEDELSDRLYNEVLTRVYSAPGRLPIMLLVAYSNVQDGMLQLHRPETCYPVGGYRLTETKTEQLGLGPRGSLPVRTFTASAPTRVEHVLYWTRIGPELPTSWSNQRLSVVRANLRGEIPDGILIRASAVTADAKMAQQEIATFVRSLVSAVDAKTRALFVGPLA